jgi:hypothetical protein
MGSDRRGGQLALVIFVACVRLRLSTPDNHHRDPLLVVWRPRPRTRTVSDTGTVPDGNVHLWSLEMILGCLCCPQERRIRRIIVRDGSCHPGYTPIR